jgi:hypothetical protein
VPGGVYAVFGGFGGGAGGALGSGSPQYCRRSSHDGGVEGFEGELCGAPADEAVAEGPDVFEAFAAKGEGDAGAGGLVRAGTEKDDGSFGGDFFEGVVEVAFAPHFGVGDDEGIGGEIVWAAEVDHHKCGGVGGAFLLDIGSADGEGFGFSDQPPAGEQFKACVDNEYGDDGDGQSFAGSANDLDDVIQLVGEGIAEGGEKGGVDDGAGEFVGEEVGEAFARGAGHGGGEGAEAGDES